MKKESLKRKTQRPENELAPNGANLGKSSKEAASVLGISGRKNNIAPNGANWEKFQSPQMWFCQTNRKSHEAQFRVLGENQNLKKGRNMDNGILEEAMDRTSREAAVKQVAEHFRERIKNGSAPPGTMLPSICEISEQFKTDAHIIREAINALHEEHLVKMKIGCDGGTIVLAENEWKKMAVLLPDIAFGHWDMVYKEIDYFMKVRGWTLELFQHQGRLELAQQSLETISNGDYAGAIIAIPLAMLKKDDSKFGELLFSGFPIVFIGGGINCWTANDQLYACGYWGTKHLIEQKYKRIAFVGCRSYDGEEFTDGCHFALEEAGLTDVGTGYAEDEEFAIKILGGWLGMDKRPDAIFYQRSDHGQKCFYVLQSKNIQIGSEIGFMVLDDTVFHRYTAPGPSAVRRYPERIGKKAVDLFLELVEISKKERIARLNNPKREACEIAVVPGRSTCGRRKKGIIYRAMNRIPTVQEQLLEYYPPCPPMPPGYYDVR